MALGLNVSGREPLAIAAWPVLERAAAEVGETLFLVVARAGQLVVLEKAEGTGFLRAAPRLGTGVPGHATAVGKLYLALAPDLVELTELPRFTPATVRGRKALAAEVAQVRAQGWAVNLEEWQTGLAVAARWAEMGLHAATRRVIYAAEGIALRIEGRSA